VPLQGTKNLPFGLTPRHPVSDITESRFSAMNAQNDSMAGECTDVTLSSAIDPAHAKNLRDDVLGSPSA
jgi:hypothetical protein